MVSKEDKRVFTTIFSPWDHETDQLTQLDRQCSPGKLDLDPQLGRFLKFEHSRQNCQFRSPYRPTVNSNAVGIAFFSGYTLQVVGQWSTCRCWAYQKQSFDLVL